MTPGPLRLRDLRTPTERMVESFFQTIAKVDADSAEVVMALADVLTATAVTLDMHGHKSPINDRLDAFVARVRERYPEIMAEMVSRRIRA